MYLLMVAGNLNFNVLARHHKLTR